MTKNIKTYLAILTMMAVMITGCGDRADSQGEAGKKNTNTDLSSIISSSKVEVDTEFTARDLDVGYEDTTATHITMNGNQAEISGDGAIYKDGKLTISEEGTYVISGNLEDGQILVDGEETDKIQLVLNNATIHCDENAPIYIKNADKVFITLKEGTDNTLTDGKEYVQTDDNTVDGVIFSKADLIINGAGTLNITGSYKHGIASKDDLIITNGIINITAVKDALNGKDCVKIKAGTFNLSSSTGNGIQSKNGDDETKGYVYICGGSITISQCEEGIEGTVVLIEDGTIDIKAEDDGINSAAGKSSDNSTGEKTGQMASDNSAGEAAGEEISGNSGRQAPELPDMPDREMPEKGLKDMPSEVTMNEGKTDSAPNQDTPGSNNRRQGMPGNGHSGGGGEFQANENCYILIKGGEIRIDALGDGIDSNGFIYISGGNLYVSGPENNGNGGLDYNGTAQIEGGTVVITGSTGMAQGFSDTSAQYSLLYNLSAVSAGDTPVILKDSDGKTLVSYEPAKQYQSVVISSPDMKKDETYTLISGEQTAEIKLTSIVTSNAQGGMGFPGRQRLQEDQSGQPEQQEQPEQSEQSEDNQN